MNGGIIISLITKSVKVKWNAKNRKWYEGKGYIFTKTSEVFEINTSDLITTSHIKVDCKCDSCGKERNMTYQEYCVHTIKTGKYFCIKCAHQLYGGKTLQKTLLKNNGVSFYDWCVNNLTKEKANEIILRWDYDKNKISPKDICYSSGGFNRKGYWFKCLDNSNHKSELKDICSFTTGHGSLDCKQCKSIANTNPEYIKYFYDKNDAYKYSVGSMAKVKMKCQECGFVKQITINNFTRQGFGCNRCSDKVSYPEKFLFNLLEQLNLKFEVQLGKDFFTWCKKYKYDFYLIDYNIIIEIHGLQHYQDVSGWNQNTKTLEEEQENDRIKKELALKNGIKEHNYIIIDARYSDLNYIKNSILNNTFVNNFDVSNVNWEKCGEFALSSFIKKACELWEGGLKSTKLISEKMKLGQSTITNYLKKGTEIGWCNYNPIHKKQVICLTTGEIFNSLTDACKKYKLNPSNLSVCVNGYTKTCGVDLITKERLQWSVYSERGVC